MLKNKLNVSVPWLIRSNSHDVFKFLYLSNLTSQLFIKNKLFISDIYFHEFPLYSQLIIEIYPFNIKAYKNILLINSLIKSIISLITNKNVNLYFKLSPHLFNNASIFSKWLNKKIYYQPLKLKRLMKRLSYASIINKSKSSR